MAKHLSGLEPTVVLYNDFHLISIINSGDASVCYSFVDAFDDLSIIVCFLGKKHIQEINLE